MKADTWFRGWRHAMTGLFPCCWAMLPARLDAAAPAYCELRPYSVTSNKLDGVLERFRETVGPVRRKHGITAIQ